MIKKPFHKRFLVFTLQITCKIYNNKTLDMIFKDNAKAYYEGSELLGGIIEYSNSKRFISVSNKIAELASKSPLIETIV